MPPVKKMLRYTEISRETFDTLLSRYPSTVPEKLRELDELRYNTIPATVASRTEKGAHLTKDEVEKLVEWKLYVEKNPFHFHESSATISTRVHRARWTLFFLPSIHTSPCRLSLDLTTCLHPPLTNSPRPHTATH
jgi:hypothetical protein